MTKIYKIKDNYNDIQIIEVNSYNKNIDDLNELYDILNETTGMIEINNMNRKIELQKEHMKRIKPNWLKR